MSVFIVPEFSEHSEIHTFAHDLRHSEQPEGPLEEALIDRIIRAAYRVRSADNDLDDNGLANKDALRVLADAERAWTRALSDWTRYRKAQKSPRPTSKTPPQPSPSPSPMPTPAPDPQPGPGPGPAASLAPLTPAVAWRDHIIVDPDFHSFQRIFKGTTFPVDFLLPLFDEGFSTEKLLKDFPELTATQIEAARLWATDDDSRRHRDLRRFDVDDDDGDDDYYDDDGHYDDNHNCDDSDDTDDDGGDDESS